MKIFKFREYILESENILGGLADGLSIKDLAEKHKLPISKIEKALQVGKNVEMEHTDDPKVAYEIAKDHIFEDPDYYKKLAKIEK